jgi:alpha/beta superfamily hydrolase
MLFLGFLEGPKSVLKFNRNARRPFSPMAVIALQKPFILKTKTAQLSAVLHPAAGSRLVILCHGFTGHKLEHNRLFLHTARALQKAGLNVLRFDFMGSGDSSGEFSQMSPNTQVRDTLDVLAWGRRRYKKVALLGLSFGGATVICASYQAKVKPNALLTWSSVPDFKWWEPKPRPEWKTMRDNPMVPGLSFFRDRPKVNVPEAYVALNIPRMQIQGDQDIPEFRERFEAYCPKSDPLVQHLVIPGADHVFGQGTHRRRVIAESARWLRKQLA